MPIAIPQRAADGPSTLPLSSEPPDTTKIPTNTPKLQAPTTPAPGSAPTLPVAQPAPAAPTTTAPSTQPVSRAEPVAASPTPAAPTPYQTNDPLAFMPMPSPTETVSTDLPPSSGTTNVSGSQVTEGPGFLPPNLGTPASGMSVPPAAQAPIPTSGGSPSYGLTPTTPQGSLLNQTITPGPGVDRYAIANDLLSQWDANSQPQEEAQIKALEQSGAARGQIGSGMMRGALADESNRYQTARTTAQRGFLTDALNGSVEDSYRNLGVAQDQQKFQAGQAQQGFNNNVTLQGLQDSEQGQMWTQQMQSMGFNAQQMQAAFENAYRVQQLSDDETGQAFSRAMQQFVLGSQGSPQSIEEWLAGLYALPQGNGLTA